ncbi:M-phase-specific PLK1-interacting protein [Gadus chalcogrammus]|uniref:M-phase-specific PLK1-interacting protein n=1 Tax=Gadus chalcogrammus TaxID=1042646 RepID=UPI0024C4C9DE|nr:M-phase-specific PLK1-interacting protein [Gadus chalcogrammus]
MQRGNTRFPSPGGMRPPMGGFRSPGADNQGSGDGGRFCPPTLGYRGSGSPSTGQRFGNFGGSPNSSRDFGNNNRSFGPSEGYYGNTSSPMRTPRRQDGNGRGGQSYRHQSPYQTHSPSPYRRGFQGSPQTSTPFVRERGGGGVEKYYSPSMVQDPWASLKPVEVTQTGTKSSTPNTFHTGKTTRYF